MNIREAVKKYFGRYNDADEAEEAERKKRRKKAKKKKQIPAGSYSKSTRKQYEQALEEAGDY